MGKLIERPWGGGNCNRFPIQTRIFGHERVKESGPFQLPPLRWSETERRWSVQRLLLLPLGIQSPIHLHTLVQETCYFTFWVRASILSIVNSDTIALCTNDVTNFWSLLWLGRWTWPVQEFSMGESRSLTNFRRLWRLLSSKETHSTAWFPWHISWK